jgi:hypothetical protein
MKLLITIAFLFNAVGTMACECIIIPAIKNKEDLKTYEFVAVVKIERIDVTSDNSREDRNVNIKVKELFKGGNMGVLNVQDFNNPCGKPAPKLGEELLVLGYLKDRHIQISTCSFYRLTEESPDPSPYGLTEQLKVLRRIYEHN